MNNQSGYVFRNNLEYLLKTHSSYEKLSFYLDVPTSTLKSWINANRVPSLKMLDKISNKLGCYSSDLLTPNYAFNEPKSCVNDSHITLVRNLSIIFINNHCFSTASKLALMDNVITDYALQSYMRNTNYKSPTLEKLDLIANALDLHTYELLKENIE